MDIPKFKFDLRRNCIDFQKGNISRPEFKTFISNSYKDLKSLNSCSKTELKKELNYFSKKFK